MRNVRRNLLLAAVFASAGAEAVEVTVANDSVTDSGTATIVSGFVVDEEAASWLTSPCDGNIRAVQVFWRSFTGTTGTTIHSAIDIRRSGAFPTPGAIAQTIGGPVLNDGVINEWRFIDENNVIPVNVPVTNGEVFVVSLRFSDPPPASGPSVVRDNDGIQAGRNAIRANVSGTFFWFNAATLGVTGDWVIRAVVDCPVVASEADVSVAMSASNPVYSPGSVLGYTLVVSNAGPVAANNTTVVDIFPPSLGGVSWTCSGSGGGTCPPSGSGNISQLVNLPSGGAVTFDIGATVAPGTTGTITNSATAVVPGGVTDTDPANNSISVNVDPVPQADVSVSMSASPERYTAGAQLSYTLVVQNAGPGAAPNTTLVDVFPAALTGVTWTCSTSGGATCTAAGSGNLSLQVGLPAAASVTFVASGTVAPGTTVPLVNSLTAVLSAAAVDPVPGNNSVSLETLRQTFADLGLGLAVDPPAYLPGQALALTLVIDNAGPDAAPGSLVTSTLPAQYVDSDWTCVATGGASCVASGSGNLVQTVDLPAGSSVAFEFAGSVAAGTSGVLGLQAEVQPGGAVLDPAPGNNAQILSLDPGSTSIGIFADGFEPP